MSKYKLNIARDVDIDEDVYILNLPRGFRFSDDIVHVRGFDSMREMRDAIKNEVIVCNNKCCTEE